MKTQNPFPGMNPFFEQQWRDAHTRLITYLHDALQERLPSDLIARAEEGEGVTVGAAGEKVTYYPDVQVRERGRFRSYLLGALNHFLADEWDRRHRLKRGGQMEHVPFDTALGEARYALESIDERSPDRLFERRWALALLDLVWGQLQREYQAAGKERLFARLNMFLTDSTLSAPSARPGVGVGASRKWRV